MLEQRQNDLSEVLPSPYSLSIDHEDIKNNPQILKFQKFYNDVCGKSYRHFSPLQKDFSKDFDISNPDLQGLTSVVKKADEFRRSGGEIGNLALTKQLRDIGNSDLSSVFLMRDIVSSVIFDDKERFENYTNNDLRCDNFGKDKIREVLYEMGIPNGPNSDEAKSLSFDVITYHLLKNPYFNHEKMI